jgi:Aminotransferase class I and II
MASYKAADEARQHAVELEVEPIDHDIGHGGNLDAARSLFPGAPEPFVDLSTGINPNPYPVPPLSGDVFARLPDSAVLANLIAVAAVAYGAPSTAHVVPAPGTQILLPLIASLVRPGRAAVLSPTYAEHARAARLAGHHVVDVGEVGALAEFDLAILTNPNNPDGRLSAKDELAAIAAKLDSRGGLLLVDEAFMDVGPPATSLAGEVGRSNVVVLRSFGKFFGLAGVGVWFFSFLPLPSFRTHRGAIGTLGRVRTGACRGCAGAGGSSLDRVDARTVGAGRKSARRHLDRIRSRYCRRHDLIPSGAQPSGGRALSTSRTRGNLCPQICRSAAMAALRPAGGGAGLAAARASGRRFYRQCLCAATQDRER